MYKRQLFTWLVAEGALVGLAGGVIGVVFGHGLAWGALALLGGDLGAGYFSGLKPTLEVQPSIAAIYIGLGVLAGIAGAWLPAREAATVSPARALRVGDEAALLGGEGHPWLGLLLLTAGVTACVIPPVDGLPLGGYLAIACLLAGSVPVSYTHLDVYKRQVQNADHGAAFCVPATNQRREVANRIGIDGAIRLVKQDQRGILQHHAGKTNTL